MSVIKLESKETKPDLVVDYKGKEYVLPGSVSAGLIERILANVENPTELAKIVLAEVIPQDFKDALAQADIEPLVNLWSNYINAPKEQPSDN